MPTGTIKKYFHDRGFGFIRPDDSSADIFVHIKSAKLAVRVERWPGAGLAMLVEGQHLSYDVQTDPQSGRPCATNLALLDAE
jgi:cold shock protein